MNKRLKQLEKRSIEGFGDEWSRFDQTGLLKEEKEKIFHDYFHQFPMEELSKGSEGFDMGCGSGRWASLMAPRVRVLNCIDASSDALRVAEVNLSHLSNCKFLNFRAKEVPLANGSQDFGYSLGVLHHTAEPLENLKACSRLLKKDAPFLVYLYYRFDNRPWWYRQIWSLSELFRRVISKLPHPARYAFSQLLAAIVYWPLARATALFERMGVNVNGFPLSYYRQKSFYVMRTDSLDRFGTRLEQRYTRGEITSMLESAGFKEVVFSDTPPFWCAVARKS